MVQSSKKAVRRPPVPDASIIEWIKIGAGALGGGLLSAIGIAIHVDRRISAVESYGQRLARLDEEAEEGNKGRAAIGERLARIETSVEGLSQGHYRIEKKIDRMLERDR